MEPLGPELREELIDALDLRGEHWGYLPLLAEAGYQFLYGFEGGPSQAIFEAVVLLAPEDPVGPLGLAEAHLVHFATKMMELEPGEAAAPLRDHLDEAIELAGGVAGRSDLTTEVEALAFKALGHALALAGEMDEGRERLRHAAELAPNSTAGLEAAELLQGLEPEPDAEEPSGEQS